MGETPLSKPMTETLLVSNVIIRCSDITAVLKNFFYSEGHEPSGMRFLMRVEYEC